MKINGTNGIDVARLYANKASERKPETERKDRAESGKPVDTDSVELSGRAKQLQAYRLALSDMPPVRKELVNQLRQEIHDGSYGPNERLIAEGIAREMRDRVKGE